MTAMLSIGAKVKRCLGLVDTKDINERTNTFLKSVAARTHDGSDTRSLTEKQVEWIEDIFDRHFGG